MVGCGTCLSTLSSSSRRHPTQMDKPESQSLPADSGHNLVAAKRTASEEPNASPDAKRIKGAHDGSTEPGVKSPAVTKRVPFPDRVC